MSVVEVTTDGSGAGASTVVLVVLVASGRLIGSTGGEDASVSNPAAGSCSATSTVAGDG